MNTVEKDLVNEILERNARINSAPSGAIKQSVGLNLNELQETLHRCLIESTKSVFSTMCGWTMDDGLITKCNGFSLHHDISGIVTLNGAVEATVVVSFDQELVYSAVEKFLGERPSSLNADVVDLVGEFANMIGGNAQERLSMPNVALGLPTVVGGTGHFIAHNPSMAFTMIPFTGLHGSVSIELGLM